MSDNQTTITLEEKLMRLQVFSNELLNLTWVCITRPNIFDPEAKSWRPGPWRVAVGSESRKSFFAHHSATTLDEAVDKLLKYMEDWATTESKK